MELKHWGKTVFEVIEVDTTISTTFIQSSY